MWRSRRNLERPIADAAEALPRTNANEIVTSGLETIRKIGAFTLRVLEDEPATRVREHAPFEGHLGPGQVVNPARQSIGLVLATHAEAYAVQNDERTAHSVDKRHTLRRIGGCEARVHIGSVAGVAENA